VNVLNGSEPRHWLDGVRCPDCGTLNASWLFYKQSDGPTVECDECGAVCRVLDDGTKQRGERGAVQCRRHPEGEQRELAGGPRPSTQSNSGANPLDEREAS
jgi:Zn ribbon nucleic-acid-binding protein